MLVKADGKISKTMVFNAIAFVLAVALPVLEANGFVNELPSELSVFVAPAIVIVNMILRKFFTSQPLA